MARTRRIVVFCDLDDTLFGAFDATILADALATFERLEREGAAVILCSNRTRAELERIQDDFGIRHPFIAESGAALFIPNGYFSGRLPRTVVTSGYAVMPFAKPYRDTVSAMRIAAERLGVRLVGFHDMTVEEVAASRGLSLLEARLAKLREYSEPFHLPGASLETTARLLKTLGAAKIDCVRRGPFHVAGVVPIDVASRHLVGLYQQAGADVVTVALADHSSAVPLLRRSHVSCVVRSPLSEETTRVLAEVPNASLSDVHAIAAWADAILDRAYSLLP